jgi:ankyrin repeat protein
LTIAGAQAGATPIHFGLRFQQTAAAETLIEKGADINAKDKVHARPRHAPRLRPSPALIGM